MSEDEPSYACGTSDVALGYRTVGQAFDDTVARWAARPGLVVRHQSIRWTYRELGKRVDRVAAGLLALGLAPGDRVGIWSPNNAEWVITQFATAKAGLILVNINPAYRVAELEYALNAAGCRALVLADAFKGASYVEMLRELAPEISRCAPRSLESARLPALKTAIVIADDPASGFLSFSRIASLATPESSARLHELRDSLQPDDPINIQFTSGTTGFPKGATLSHHNILNNGFFVARRMRFSEADRLCIPVPLYHCFGMVMGVLGCLTHGACMVFPADSFDPLSVLECVAAEQCTALYGVPTMFIAELEHPDFAQFDLSCLRTGVMAGAPCPVAVMKRVIEDMHMREVTICYGMTETSPVSLQSLPDDSLEKRVSTVGAVHPYVEIKIVDAAGRSVSRGTQGELLTRGYSVMHGYWGDEDRTREAIDVAGWMHTGDLAVMDGNGYVAITGRVKDMVIRGGENIYPREIEEFLYRHPAILDVQVFGVPDAKYGEELAAWIILKDGEKVGEEDIRTFCAGQIAHFKIPRYIRFVSEFPMTVTGKVRKFVMREIMRNELGPTIKTPARPRGERGSKERENGYKEASDQR